MLNEFLYVGKANWYADAMIFALQSNISNYVLEIECDIKKAIYFRRCLNVTRAIILRTAQRKYSQFSLRIAPYFVVFDCFFFFLFIQSVRSDSN